MEPASLLRVFGAVFYDTIILFAIIFVAAQWFPLIPESMQQAYPVIIAKRIYLLAITFPYFAISWRRGGQTIGMKAWRIKLTTIDDKPVGWLQCGIRYLVAILSWMALGLGFLWILFDKNKRSWHDTASATQLLRISKPE